MFCIYPSGQGAGNLSIQHSLFSVHSRQDPGDLGENRRDVVIIATENETKPREQRNDQNHGKLQHLLWGKGPRPGTVEDRPN